MSDQLKRKVALGLVATWLLLSGICFSEEFGYFKDTPEHENQTVEQIFSSPVDRIVSISDELPGTPKILGFAIEAAMTFPPVERFTRSILSIPQYDWPPGRPKLFQLLSNYRI